MRVNLLQAHRARRSKLRNRFKDWIGSEISTALLLFALLVTAVLRPYYAIKSVFKRG